MQLERLSASLPSLDTTIDPQPVLVAPNTPLIEVIALMSQAVHRQCILRASNVHSIEGTGLGLAIGKRCGEAYQGAMTW